MSLSRHYVVSIIGSANDDVLEYSIENPYMNIHTTTRDWLRTHNEYMWGYTVGLPTNSIIDTYDFATANKASYKSIWDPSLEEYRVPYPNTWSNTTTNHKNVGNDPALYNVPGTFATGWTIYYQGVGSGPTQFYVAFGCRGASDGLLSNVGKDAHYSSCAGSSESTNIYRVVNFAFDSKNMYPCALNQRAGGFPIVCMKEE